MQLQIGVKVVIKNSEGRYLFIQRTELLQNEQEVSWDIPGGRIDAEEELRQALNREVLEELGIKLQGIPKLINAQDIFVSAKDLHVVRLTYLLSQDIDTVVLSGEHQAYQWLGLDEIGTINIDSYLKETLGLLQ